ncbi:CDP-alcohol phosphatidyltransferase family protein [Sphingomonas sp.]|uniref:CDP-alcohol phosphatidyltransferase family protein n=1 Tax=Sphingomonas sp. TaxID=28214 RepID=UPI002DD62DAE|nr:CDP-alcohol phosphatidyltransferase family protein [Sphingomonas sp.]
MIPAKDVQPLARVQDNLLARQERRLLTWICARLPAWVTPDTLTATGLAGAVMIFAGYVLSLIDIDWLLLSIAGYAVHWFGDSLDGSLARFRRIERPSYGYFIDHSCDGLAVLLILSGLGLSPFVTMDVAMAALAGYLLLSIHTFLSARVTGELKLSYVAAGPTEARLLLVGMTVTMWVMGRARASYSGFTGYDLIVGAVAALLISLFVIQTVRTGRRLARIDRL